jgi:hypothetical protein
VGRVGGAARADCGHRGGHRLARRRPTDPERATDRIVEAVNGVIAAAQRP